MKQTCPGCDDELEVTFALNMKKCVGMGLEVVVECKGCGCGTALRKILAKEKIDPEKAAKMFDNKKNYIG